MGGVSLMLTMLVLSIALLCPSLAQRVSSKKCATGVHAILARGQGPGDNLNIMVTIQGLILKQVPGSTSLALPYNHGNRNKAVAVHDGALLVQQYVREYVASCPHAKIVLVGYSMGAIVVMDALCGTSSLFLDPVGAVESSYAKNIVAAVAYGDETYVPLMPWNTGNCTLGMGQFPRLNPHSCEPFAAALHSYCDYGDTQCCGAYPQDNNAAHHTYASKYNKDVVEFIRSRLA